MELERFNDVISTSFLQCFGQHTRVRKKHRGNRTKILFYVFLMVYGFEIKKFRHVYSKKSRKPQSKCEKYDRVHLLWRRVSDTSNPGALTTMSRGRKVEQKLQIMEGPLVWWDQPSYMTIICLEKSLRFVCEKMSKCFFPFCSLDFFGSSHAKCFVPFPFPCIYV
jgi:hypothetical protein